MNVLLNESPMAIVSDLVHQCAEKSCVARRTGTQLFARSVQLSTPISQWKYLESHTPGHILAILVR